MEHPADRWRDRLRNRLLVARKDRDGIRMSAYRGALSSIDNAEVPDLTDDEIRGLIRAEIDERLRAAEQLASVGGHAHAEVMRAEAAILSELLGDV